MIFDIVIPPTKCRLIGRIGNDAGAAQINAAKAQSACIGRHFQDSRFASGAAGRKKSATSGAKPNENNGDDEIKIIELDCATSVNYLSLDRYLLDDFGFCDFVRNWTNFPSDSNIKPRCNTTAWSL
ncbi:MAG TPA: hypothetical protein VL202_25500 [Pararhizobium sp.]|uniref:hypothetical protein n=1 Tax=Pararhizobium sp. TaxID=1977563 RepID=UPI002CBFE4C0|nr:hypothetical protein [Pararhizobium sp.]HTO34499.1 hypothetical protein [Pararhizobium sp.]